MSTLYAIISLCSILIAVLYVVRALRLHTRVAFLLAYATILSVVIVLHGYILSSFTRLSDLAWWAVLGLITLALAALPMLIFPALRPICLAKPAVARDIEERITAVDRKSFSARVLMVLGLTVGLVSVINLVEVATLEPATPDAHQYHLARMVHYLQQGNLHPYDAGYWAQVVYPKVATLLHLYAYLSSGFACMTQLVQFIAYLASMLAVYGICRLLGQRRQAGAFAAGIFGVLIICLTEASTAQNDLILTAFIGAAIFFVLAYRQWRSATYLLLAAAALTLAVGVKATFLVTLPSLGLIAVFALCSRPAITHRHLAAGLLGLVLAGAVITLPSGYLENWSRYHDLFGPRAVRGKYTQEHVRPVQFISDGLRNVLRYGVDFLVLDGWYPLPHVDQLQAAITAVPRAVFTAAHIDLESPQGAREPFLFSYHKHIRADETFSSWGLLGILLVWPVAWIVMVKRSAPAGARIFAAAAMLYYLVLCFIIPYDPFHGRFFTTGALFALPPLGAFFAQPRSRIGRAYLATVVVLGCLNALIAASFRTGTALIPHTDYAGNRVPSVFTLTESQLLLREAPTLNLTIFEAFVPKQAVIYTDLRYAAPEYLFFGEQYTRRVISLRPFDGPRKALPATPTKNEFLLYDRTSPYYRRGDLPLASSDSPLGELYLRELAPPRR